MIVLFDIDGTILTVNEKSRLALESGFKAIFGDHLYVPLKRFAGRTDWEIYKNTLSHFNISTQQQDENWRPFRDAYFDATKRYISREDIVIHPGVELLIEKIHHHPDVLLGLLTGNIPETANFKLSLVGLDKYFRFGSFGDDHWERPQLGPIAIDRARAHMKFEEGGKILLIGDSPRDVETANFIQATCVAVTTGKYSKAELEKNNPAFILDSLEQAIPIVNDWINQEVS